MSQVKPRPLEWLWPGWLALGKLAVVDADPEQGKAFVLLDLAARLSRGAPMPDECETETGRNGETATEGNGETATPNGCHAFAADAAPAPLIPRPPAAKACHPRPPMDVTMLTAEDSLEDTVFPRLEAAGADLSRIHILKPIRVGQTFLSAQAAQADKNVCPTLRLPRDLPLVEQIIQQTQSRLLVIDPSLADLDRHCLHLLADLADRLRCTVVIQRYLNKLAGTRAICRGGGSMSVIGAARTALLIARDPREEAIRILASTKNNFGPRPSSLRFVLVPHPYPSPPVGGGQGGGTCRVHWLGPSPLGADDLLAIQSATEAKTAVAEAIKFLKEFLQDGPKDGQMCHAEAQRAQIAPSTLRRAKLRLGVMHNKPRSLLGLFLPATWELPGREEHEPPHSVSYGAMDESPQHNLNDDKEIG
jgi:hypothetical protein